MSTPFQLAWARTHRAEGGYVDHPSDPGGRTNHGITERVARAHGFKGDMRDLSPAKAEEIAKREYWDALRLDDVAAISEPIAQEMFDTNLNMWNGAAVQFLQRALNALNHKQAHYADLKVDGRIGEVTLAALRAYLAKRKREGELVLLRCLNGLQLADYERQTVVNELKEDFFYGWVLNRVTI